MTGCVSEAKAGSALITRSRERGTWLRKGTLQAFRAPPWCPALFLLLTEHI
jgi:hypothetical protein